MEGKGSIRGQRSYLQRVAEMDYLFKQTNDFRWRIGKKKL